MFYDSLQRPIATVGLNLDRELIVSVCGITGMLVCDRRATDHVWVDQVEGLLGDDLATIGEEQSQSDAPANAD